MNVTSLIAHEEGFRAEAYRCSENYPTIGYGQKLGIQNMDPDLITAVIPEPVARLWLETNIKKLSDQLAKNLDLFNQMNEQRQAILISMSYQLGYNGLLKFRRMLAALAKGDYEEAAEEALDSRWSEQTPCRAAKHAEVLKTGTWGSYARLDRMH